MFRVFVISVGFVALSNNFLGAVWGWQGWRGRGKRGEEGRVGKSRKLLTVWLTDFIRSYYFSRHIVKLQVAIKIEAVRVTLADCIERGCLKTRRILQISQKSEG